MLTLYIRILDRYSLGFGFLTQDPMSGVNCLECEIKFSRPCDQVLGEETDGILLALRSGDSKLIHQRIRLATKIIFPAEVVEILRLANERFLYIDLHETLTIFPWEVTLIDTNLHLYQRFFIGRGVRFKKNDAIKKCDMSDEFVIIAADGSLPATAKESKALKSILKSNYNVQIYNHMLCEEFFPALEGVGGLHYSGHSDSFSLSLSDGMIKGKEIAANGRAPFFVFLNSCKSGDLLRIPRGESSLISGFLRAGAKNIIAPLEIVDDEAAALFSAAFYHGFVQANLAIGEAFAAARKIPVLCNRILVPYVLYGNPMFKLASGVHQKSGSPERSDKPAQMTETNVVVKYAKESPAPAYKDLVAIVLEPSSTVAGMINKILLKLGVKKVIRFMSYHEGQRYLAGHKVDLILCNTELNDGSGLDFLRSVRNGSAKSGVPFVLLGPSDREEVTFAAVWEIAAYLVKPIHPDEATAKLTMALQEIRNPNSYDMKISRAMAAMQANSLDSALNIIQDAINQFPERPRALIHKAEILAKSGRHASAIACLKASIDLQPQFYKAYEILGNILLQQGLLTEALRYIEIELTYYPKLYQKQFQRRLQIAQILMNSENFEEALIHLKSARLADKQSKTVLLMLIKANAKLGNIHDALKWFASIDTGTDESLDPLLDIVQAAAKTNKCGLLIRYLKTKGIARRSTYYKSLLGPIYKALAQQEEALLMVESKNPRIGLVEAAIYFGLGEFEKALASYAAILAKLPSDRVALEQYCATLWQLKRYAEAAPFLEKLRMLAS